MSSLANAAKDFIDAEDLHEKGKALCTSMTDFFGIDKAKIRVLVKDRMDDLSRGLETYQKELLSEARVYDKDLRSRVTDVHQAVGKANMPDCDLKRASAALYALVQN